MQKLAFNGSPAALAALLEFCRKANAGGAVSAVVSEILAGIREKGDRAVLEYTRQFDGAKLTAANLRISPNELKAAVRALPATDRSAIREGIACVRDFHRRTLPKDWTGRNPQGGIVGERFYPIRRVGLYIPGGNAPLVSTVIMTAVPAGLARCPEIAVCTPPQKNGSVDPAMLAVLSLCGVREVYRIGGVQAIGALAYGTANVPAVDKVFGPGNAFVMEAKRQVFGTVGVDLLPGPSEVMVIADSGANPAHVAADLLAQAEHGTGKEIIYLVSTAATLIKQVEKAAARMLPEIRHGKKCAHVMEERCIAVTCHNLALAADIANAVAPEHLELQVADKSIASLTRAITTAGAILQGYHTPTVLGDFTAGPSHTLPTGRAGRFFSGLQVTDFMRRSSIVRYNRTSLARAAPVVKVFASMEKLDAHGRSLTIRLPVNNVR